MPSLTQQLLSAEQATFTAATQHAFLERAGRGTLAAEKLGEWLVQDKYYQDAYVPFVEQLMGKVEG